MNILDAIILGIVEGLTEFLPISSTGHMIIVSHFLNIADDSFTKSFEVIIQLAAILTVCLIYRKRIFNNLFLLKQMMIAFLPAAVFGFLLKNHIEQMLSSLMIVIVTLILGGVVLIFIDRFKPKKMKSLEDLNPLDCLKLGLFQCLALIPGVSRSGATIVGGLLLGLKKEDATEFSFFLAIPTMFAATGYKLAKLLHSDQVITNDQWIALSVGFVVSFIVAAIALKGFVHFVSRRGLHIFGWYRIALGFLLLLFW